MSNKSQIVMNFTYIWQQCVTFPSQEQLMVIAVHETATPPQCFHSYFYGLLCKHKRFVGIDENTDQYTATDENEPVR